MPGGAQARAPSVRRDRRARWRSLQPGSPCASVDAPTYEDLLVGWDEVSRRLAALGLRRDEPCGNFENSSESESASSGEEGPDIPWITPPRVFPRHPTASTSIPGSGSSQVTTPPNVKAPPPILGPSPASLRVRGAASGAPPPIPPRKWVRREDGVITTGVGCVVKSIAEAMVDTIADAVIGPHPSRTTLAGPRLDVRPHPHPIMVPQFDPLQEKIRVQAAKHQLDEEFYCYMATKALMGGRSVRRFGELKSKAETWLREYRQDMPEVWKLSQATRAVDVLMGYTAVEDFIFDKLRHGNYWLADGPTSQVAQLDRFAKTGTLPRNFSRFWWFGRSIPYQ